MKRLVSSGLWVSSFTVGVIPLAYLIRLVLTRHLSLTEFGFFYAVLSLFDIIQSVNDLGFSETQLYFLPKYLHQRRYDKVKATVKTQLFNQLITTFLVGLAIFWFAPWLAEHIFNFSAGAGMIKILALYFILKDFLLNVKVLFFSYQEAKAYGSQEVVRILATLSLLILAIGLIGLDLQTVAWIWVVVHGVLAAGYFGLFFWKHRAILQAPGYPVRQIYREFIPYLLPTLAANHAGNIFTAATEIMLAFFKGVADVGLYNIAKPISNLALGIASPLAAVLKPFVSEIHEQRDEATISILVSIILNVGIFLLLPLSTAVVFYAPESITLLFGAQFVAAAPTLRVIAIDIIFTVLSPFIFGIVFGLGLQKSRAVIIYASSLINLMLSLLLIPVFGPVGVALANLVYSVIAVSGGIWIIRQQLQFSIPVLNFLKMAGLIGVFILSQVLLKFVSTPDTLGQLALFVLKVGIGLSLYYGIGIFVLKIVDLSFMFELLEQALPRSARPILLALKGRLT